jgi:hypothetical protein
LRTSKKQSDSLSYFFEVYPGETEGGPGQGFPCASQSCIVVTATFLYFHPVCPYHPFTMYLPSIYYLFTIYLLSVYLTSPLTSPKITLSCTDVLKRHFTVAHLFIPKAAQMYRFGPFHLPGTLFDIIAA